MFQNIGDALHRTERQRDRDDVHLLLAAVAHEFGDSASYRDVRMDGGNTVGVETIIVDPYNFECVWFRLQPLDEFAATFRCKGDASHPRADRGGERQKTTQRRLKPSAYAYRRKPGCGEKERKVQNTHHARKDARRNRFCAAPAGPTLSEAGHQSLVPGEEKKQYKARRARATADSNLRGFLRPSF